MKKTQPVVVPEEVRRVKKDFKRWRCERKRNREPIPSRLWAAAAKLCETHGISRVSKWLRLDYVKLKDQAAKTPRTARESRPAFVEWSPPAGNLSVSAAEYIVELADREGGVQRIHVRGANIAEVAALSRELRSGGD